MDWFQAGARVGAGKKSAAQYPPLGDPQAQRFWLGGFGAAWAEGPDDTPLLMALTSALDEQQALLLHELRSHGRGPTQTPT